MRQTLKVQFGKKKGYSIEISDDDFLKFNQDIKEFTGGQKRLIVISKKVYKLYNEDFDFDEDEIFVLPDGEKEKNYKNYIKILEKATKIGLTRKDVIIAIGGGVVGDIAGFAASTYMRGIDFIQVPTTLLSAVDSSVGGKTAIDLADAKNIIGTFYQPKKVFININFLETLDERQYYSGLGEVLKYAFIEESCELDVPLFLFEFLTLSSDKIQIREPITVMRMIEYCLRLKISVVTKDEKESGLRKILNFGHTFAHALETISKYRRYTHGEAVVYGMFLIFNWAYKNEYINYSYYRQSVELLGKYDFEEFDFDECITETDSFISLPCFTKYTPEKIVEIMKKDKKATSEKITFIVPFGKKIVKEIKLLPSDVLKMFEY